MVEAIAAKITAMSLLELLIIIGFVVVCAISLLWGIASAFDRLNVKSFSFRNGFVFYQDGEDMPRSSRRKRAARSKTK